MGTCISDPFVSVIIAVRNAAGELSRCVASLLRMDYPENRREIVFVDCGSTDGSAALLKRHPVRYVGEKGSGIAHGRNQGIEVSRGEILAFTDPDCVVTTQWLRELVRPFQDPGVGGAAGAILPFPGTTPAERFAARRRSHGQERPLSHPTRPFALTPNVAFRREAMERVGCFDASFPGGGWEDADFCWRMLRQTRFALAYAPRAAVLHRYRTTAGAFFVQHVRYGFGLALLRRKYHDELSWTTADSLRAWLDVGAAAGGVCTALIQEVSRKTPDHPLENAAFGFLRLFGQRLGVLQASLQSPLRVSGAR